MNYIELQFLNSLKTRNLKSNTPKITGASLCIFRRFHPKKSPLGPWVHLSIFCDAQVFDALFSHHLGFDLWPTKVRSQPVALPWRWNLQGWKTVEALKSQWGPTTGSYHARVHPAWSWHAEALPGHVSQRQVSQRCCSNMKKISFKPNSLKQYAL